MGRDEREFRQGEIFLVKDELINIPDTFLDLRGRAYHRRRPVVILYDIPSNINPNSYTVIAAPASHRTDMKRETDLICPKSEGGFKQDSIIRLGLIQPFLKIDLEGPVGRLPEKQLLDLVALMLYLLGVDLRGQE
ncbi:MAG: type II toxin-antitoxin system PemK/MazF family toxin [Peptococcaceae bacterium]|nr:type II toxin-antitoxin system PemK/MazF family toxin [Peptococcaceae bacterium]